MKTFEQYLADARANDIIDFRLRTVENGDGGLDFYIHPADKDGDTGDFEVLNNAVIPLSVGAGSRR